MRGRSGWQGSTQQLQEPHPSASNLKPGTRERHAAGTKLSCFTPCLSHARCKSSAELLLPSVIRNTLCRALSLAIRGSPASACLWLFPCSHLPSGLAACSVPGWQYPEAALKIEVVRRKEEKACLGEEVTPADRGQGCLPAKLEDLTALSSPESVSSPLGQADLTWLQVLRCESAPAELQSPEHSQQAGPGCPMAEPRPWAHFWVAGQGRGSPSSSPPPPARQGWQAVLPAPRGHSAPHPEQRAAALLLPAFTLQHVTEPEPLLLFLFSHSLHPSAALLLIQPGFAKTGRAWCLSLAFPLCALPQMPLPLSAFRQAQPWPQVPRTPDFPWPLQFLISILQHSYSDRSPACRAVRIHARNCFLQLGDRSTAPSD